MFRQKRNNILLLASRAKGSVNSNRGMKRLFDNALGNHATSQEEALRIRCVVQYRKITVLRGSAMKIPLSVLDLAPIGTGFTSTQALTNTIRLAQLAEKLGYTRYWLAEHHGMPGIASSSPEVLIARVAAATQRIRVGAGG